MKENINDDIFIRHFLYGDASGLARNGDNPKVAINQRECFPSPYTLEVARQWIQYIKDNEAQTRFVIANEKEAIGEIGVVKQLDVHRHSAEIGFWIGEKYWGQGIMTRAVNWMADYCFRELDIKRLFADVVEFNHASQRVLCKCGFQLEGVFRKNIYRNEQFYDQFVYARLKDDPPPTRH